MMATVAHPGGPQWRDDDEPVEEPLKVWRWRYAAARQAGMDHDAASVFAAGDQDIGRLRSSADHHCSPGLLTDIFT